MSNCTNIGDESIVYTISTFLNLKILNLSNTRVTDQGLRLLIDNCQLLEELYLSRCVHLSESVIRHLAQSSLRLVSLDISHNKNVSEFQFKSFYLKSLRLENCVNLSESTIQHIAKTCTNLTELVSLYTQKSVQLTLRLRI